MHHDTELAKLEKDFDLEAYRPMSVVWHLRHSILSKLKAGEEVLPDIDGREETKADLIRTILSGAHPYLISEEGTGKTRLVRSVARLLPPVPVIKGCPYHDDPKWDPSLWCSRCRSVEDPVSRFGIEFIPGEARFSRIQGNEYTNEAKLLGLKDIQAIANGASPSDPEAFIGTGIFRAHRGILMIDELPAIRTKVQVLLHPLLEEQMAVLEEYNWERFVDMILIATGNPSGFSHVNEIPRPLLDRLELIFMDMPEAEVEKEIMLKERSLSKPGEYFRNNHGGRLEPNWEPLIGGEALERKVVVPWWIVEILSRTVRFSRSCPGLEKSPSIRGGTRAFEHTLSSAEMEGRRVANLHDAFMGLRLALRGRIALRSDFIDFDNPERTIKRADKVIEDMLRDTLDELARHMFRSVELNRDRFVREIGQVYSNGGGRALVQGDGQFPELERIIDILRRSWSSRLPSSSLSDYERRVFDGGDGVGPEMRGEYADSVLDFVAAGSAVRGMLTSETQPSGLFVPQRVKL